MQQCRLTAVELLKGQVIPDSVDFLCSKVDYSDIIIDDKLSKAETKLRLKQV